MPYSCSTGCTSTTSGVSSCTTISTGTPVKIPPITPILKPTKNDERSHSLLKAGSLTPVKRSYKSSTGTPVTRVLPVGQNTCKRHPATVFCTPVRRGNNVVMNGGVVGMRSCPVSPSRGASSQLNLQLTSKSTPKMHSQLKMTR